MSRLSSGSNSVSCDVAAMAVVDAKLVPVLIEKLQTELDEIKVCLNSGTGNYLEL